MFYDTTLTISAGTAKTSPATEELHVTHGVIHRVEIEFPAGCAGLVFCTISHQEHQLWPTNPDGYFCSDDYVIAFDDYYEIFGAPYFLKLKGWSPGAYLSHTLKIRVGILPRPIAEHVFGRLNPKEKDALRKAFHLTEVEE